MAYIDKANNDFFLIIRRTYNLIEHVIGYAPSKRNFSVIHVQIDDYIHFFEKISKEYCCTYLCISNIPFQSMLETFTLFTMKFDTVNACQNAWFKCHGLKGSTFFNYKKCF